MDKQLYLTNRQQRLLDDLRTHGPANGWRSLSRRTGIAIRDLYRVAKPLKDVHIKVYSAGPGRPVKIVLGE